MLKDFSRDSAERATAWRNLVSYVESKKRAIYGAPPVKRPKVVIKKPPIAEVAEKEEEVVARAAPVEVTPEVAELQRQVFEYLADYPDGTRMVVLEQEFGIARIQMARILRNLMDDNKVEKRNLLYFAI